MVAISAGNRARKAKNATPAPMIGMLSALFSAHARLTICFQPPAGISVGFSASTPGSSFSLGMCWRGRAASRCSVRTDVADEAPGTVGASAARSSAIRAAARRSAFSCTRCRIRSTELSGRPVWTMGIVLFSGDGRSVARPGAGELGEAPGAAPADQGLDHGDDRAAQGGGEEDPAQPVLALHGGGGIVLVRDLLPDQLEDRRGDRAGHQAPDQPDRTVGDLGALAHRFLHITTPTITATRAATAPRTTGGLSR